MNAQNIQGLSVSRAEAGQKLLNFLLRRVDAGKGELHRWIRTGQVRINGKRAGAFDRIEEGDIVRVPPFAVLLPAGSRGHATSFLGQEGTVRSSLNVVYEDEDVLVIDKPFGLPVQGGTGHRDSVAARLARERAGAGFVPAPVHRLDRDTTGLLAAGKTYAAVRLLTDALAGRGGTPLRKEYLAWAEGRWPVAEARELRHFLFKDSRTQRVRALPAPAAGTVEARCIVTPLETRTIHDREYSLLLVRLLTGRKHQIRAQLVACGHAVAGDPWYGTDGRPSFGLKLHAFRLELPLPRKGLTVLTCPPQWSFPWEISDSLPELEYSRTDVTLFVPNGFSGG